MIITKLSSFDMESVAAEMSDNLEEMYEDFEEDGSLSGEEGKASDALNKLNEVCDLLENTKFNYVCEKLEEVIKEIGKEAEANVVFEVTDSDELEDDIQKDIDREEEKHEMPRARWQHD